jgi:hypothetical protein
MGTMEKISFPPLITELSEKSTLYNQWYNESEMKYGGLCSQVISGWMVEVIEPIVEAAVAVNSASEKIYEVVKALYLELLKLIGSGFATRYRDDYKNAWLLMAKMPGLVVKFPAKTILLLNDVLASLHLYAPEKIMQWCTLMGGSSPEIKTIEDFKIAGRIYAWKCGLAHLRARLKTDYEELSENLQQTIVNTINPDKDITQLFKYRWENDNTKFQGVQGGFNGTTGFFEHPPRLSQIGENIFVTDTKSSYALFADRFGKILLPANTVDASYILSNSKRYDTLEDWLGKNNPKMDVNAVSSVVITEDTLVFTLQNSYYLYLFSLGNE